MNDLPFLNVKRKSEKLPIIFLFRKRTMQLTYYKLILNLSFIHISAGHC